MGGDSDGGKPPVKLKTYVALRSGVKTRSNSLGNVKLSAFELNQIIGVEDNKRPLISTEDNRSLISGDKLTGHTQTKEPSIPGIVEKFSSDVFVNEMDAISVFKPKRSVCRTPPSSTKTPTKINDNENILEQNIYKRTRSDTSSIEENPLKRQCEENQLENAENNGDLFHTEWHLPTKNTVSEQVINEFYEILDGLSHILDKDKEQEQNIQITNEEQIMIKNKHMKLCNLFTHIVFKTGQTEKENLLLKFELQKTKEKCRDTTKFINKNETTNLQKTYANIASTSQGKENPEMLLSREQEKWTTPKVFNRHETVIRIENTKDPKEAITTFKKHIETKDVGKAFKNIRQTKTGAIVVESFDKNQQEKLKKAVDTIENISVKQSKITQPTFMITGIEKGFSKEEFLEELERLNYEIVEELKTTVKDKIKVITKRQCRNSSKENWILQAPPKIAKWFLKKEKVYFDFVTVYVQEHINMAVCFNCAGFDHVAKYCKEKQCCAKCGGEHAVSDCNKERFTCPNCKKMKYDDTEHSARDIKCPIFKRRLNRYKNNINYSNDDFL